MTLLLAQLGAMKGLTPVVGLLIDTALKGSLLIAAAAIAAYLLRNRSAAARHAAWSAAVVGHLALPVLTLLVPQWRLPLFPAPPWLDRPAAIALQITPNQGATPYVVSGEPSAAGTVAPAPSVSRHEPQSVTGNSTAPTVNAVEVSRTRWPFISMLAALWLVGGLLVILRLAIGTWRVGRLAKNGDRVDDGEWLSLTSKVGKRLGITRPLTLLRGDSLAVPVTWGVVYPAVLLPPDAHEWPEARRRFVLVHEMAHVKRFDALTQLVAQITIAMLWFDPLIWIAAHRMRVEREHACDDYVLRDGTTPSLYAGELLEMVQSIGSPRHDSAAPAFAALAMARRSEFEGRMLAILDPRQNRHSLGRASAIAASVALALLVIPLAALRPFETETTKTVAAAAPVAKKATSGVSRVISDNACDSVLRANRPTDLTHIGVNDDDAGSTVIEYMTSTSVHCTQAFILGRPTFADDRLIALAPGSVAEFRELTPGNTRVVHVERKSDGGLEYIATRNGLRSEYDDTMRAWMGRVVPLVLSEAGVEAPQRVARYRAKGGVALVLDRIERLKSTSSRRAHYEALLDGAPLTDREYQKIADHAARTLSGSPADLNMVLTRVASAPTKVRGKGPNALKQLETGVQKMMIAQGAMGEALERALGKNTTSTDSANTIRRYGRTEDPEVILMALKGAKEISSSADKRSILEALVARTLGRGNSRYREAYFEVASTIDSDTDLRAVLIAALGLARNDAAITFSVFDQIKRMTSDTDKRVVLITAVEKDLLTTSAIRTAFMKTARTIQSSTDFTAVIQAAFKN